jgi:hypothetical protein
MTAPAASPAPVAAILKADPERLPWLTRMIYMGTPGPMDQGAYDAAAVEAARIIASGTCPDPFGHRLHVRWLNERCLACGGTGPSAWSPESAVPS